MLCFQVKMVRYGRQIVSVDVDAGVLLFDRKSSSFGIEKVSHNRSKKIILFRACNISFTCHAIIFAQVSFLALNGLMVLKGYAHMLRFY